MLRLQTLAGILLLLPFSPPATSSPAPQGGTCFGCLGSGGGLAVSGYPGPATVSISVSMLPGTCHWLLGVEPDSLSCRQIVGCLPIVTRTWSGLPPNTPLEFCVTLATRELCLNAPAVTNSGSGTGSDEERESAPQACDDARTRLFSIECESCGLLAVTETHCSSCSEL